MATDKETLSAICDLFHIGVAARQPHIIMENVRNVIRRNDCLSAVERKFFTIATPPDPDEDEPGEECMLPWGANPDGYVEAFGVALRAPRLRYDVLHEIAATFNLDYNAVCRCANAVPSGVQEKRNG